MDDAADRVRIETLLAHAGWLRGLSRRLVSDPLSAEDVVQDTWLAAIEHPPREATGARAWLGAVARNVVRARGRSDSRRSKREEKARAPASQPEPSVTVEKLELHAMLVELVRALDEPERTTILMRYFEGMPPGEIAARTGIPASTVRSRLQRGIDRLRARLDARHGGDRRAWSLMLLPLTGLDAIPAATSVATLTLGGLIMATKIKLAVVVTALVLAALILWRVVGTPEDPSADPKTSRPDIAASERSGEAEEKGVPAAADEKPRGGEPPPAEHAPVDTKATDAAPSRPRGADVPPTGIVTGTVKLHDGSPPREVEVVLKRVPMRDDPEGMPTEYAAALDGEGRFRVEDLPKGSYSLEVSHPDLAGYRRSIYLRDERGAGPYDITLHPGGTLLVRVLDATGVPMAGQKIACVGPSQGGGRSFGRNSREETDAEGVLRKERLPMGRYQVTWFSSGAQTMRTVTIAPGRTTEVVFSHGTALLGTAFGPEGAPLGNSIVRLHPVQRGEGYRAHQTNTKDDGAYEVVGLTPGKYRVTVQVLMRPGRPGYVCDILEVELVEGERLTQDLHVKPTAIEGRVTRKDDGTPLMTTPRQQVQISAWRVLEMKGDEVVKRGASIMAFADKDGRYAFKGIEPGKYQIWIASFVRDLREAWRVVDVPPGGLRDVDFPMETRNLGTLRLTVTAPDGSPVDKLMFVNVVGDSSTTLHRSGGGPGGVHIFQLEAGTRKVGAYRAGYRADPDPVSVEITAGKTVEAKMVMHRLVAIMLKVTEPDGLPAKKLSVMVTRADGKPRPAYARPKGEGAFLLWLDPGKMTLRVSTKTGTSDPIEVTLAPNETVEETILLRGK
jgi:RNA polymerase sigma factor (sigma-70 family)